MVPSDEFLEWLWPSTRWVFALGAAAVLMGCDRPDRVGTPDELPMHARIGDDDHHGRGSICLPLGEFGACPVDLRFYAEPMGFVTGGHATSVVIRGDVRVLPGAGPNVLIFRPGERPEASIFTTASGRLEPVAISDFEIELDGSTHRVDGSITSMVAEVFEFWGDIDVACQASEHTELVTETGEVRAIRCDRAW